MKKKNIHVVIAVPENWEDRLDMQDIIEEEIKSDRWLWQWAEPLPDDTKFSPWRDPGRWWNQLDGPDQFGYGFIFSWAIAFILLFGIPVIGSIYHFYANTL